MIDFGRFRILLLDGFFINVPMGKLLRGRLFVVEGIVCLDDTIAVVVFAIDDCNV